MTKFKSILFTLLAAGVFFSLSSATANAQFPWSAVKDQQKWANNPCSDWKISWELWDETAGITKPAGGIDCNPANYGSWSTPEELHAKLREYRSQLRSQNVTFSAPSPGADRHIYQSAMQNGRAVFRIDYGLVAQGGGNLVAQGGGNIISTNSANKVSTGNGKIYHTLGANDVAFIQLPGRWIKVTK